MVLNTEPKTRLIVGEFAGLQAAFPDPSPKIHKNRTGLRKFGAAASRLLVHTVATMEFATKHECIVVCGGGVDLGHHLDRHHLTRRVCRAFNRDILALCHRLGVAAICFKNQRQTQTLESAGPCVLWLAKPVRVQPEFRVFLHRGALHQFGLGIGDFFDGGVFQCPQFMAVFQTKAQPTVCTSRLHRLVGHGVVVLA